jgi:hypothetical protein
MKTSSYTLGALQINRTDIGGSGSNILLNGNFETPAINTSYVLINGLAFTDLQWYYGGSRIFVISNYNGNRPLCTGGIMQYIALDRGDSFIYQNISIVSSGNYYLSFYYGTESSFHCDAFSIKINNVTVDTLSVPSNDYTWHQYINTSVALTAGTNILKIGFPDGTTVNDWIRLNIDYFILYSSDLQTDITFNHTNPVNAGLVASSIYFSIASNKLNKINLYNTTYYNDLYIKNNSSVNGCKGSIYSDGGLYTNYINSNTNNLIYVSCDLYQIIIFILLKQITPHLIN